MIRNGLLTIALGFAITLSPAFAANLAVGDDVLIVNGNDASLVQKVAFLNPDSVRLDNGRLYNSADLVKVKSYNNQITVHNEVYGIGDKVVAQRTSRGVTTFFSFEIKNIMSTEKAYNNEYVQSPLDVWTPANKLTRYVEKMNSASLGDEVIANYRITDRGVSTQVSNKSYIHGLTANGYMLIQTNQGLRWAPYSIKQILSRPQFKIGDKACSLDGCFAVSELRCYNNVRFGRFYTLSNGVTYEEYQLD